jgi:hypothetical protein
LKKNLIIFTRYPVAGQSKTRLIPALGAVAAAKLQRQMTEQTLQTAESLAAEDPLVELEIRHAGGGSAEMAEWLGHHRTYVEQGPGDLGQKMATAFAAAFQTGSRQVLLIGADCPALSSEILATGFRKLTAHDLVLGPASDGGYYLIGLNSPCAELFENRSWGSKLILAETLATAENLGFKIHLLEELADVDRPADLAYFSNYPDPE